MREAYSAGEDATQATVTGFSASARVVTAAALIMVSVFASFVTDQALVIKSIAFALAFGIPLRCLPRPHDRDPRDPPTARRSRMVAAKAARPAPAGPRRRRRAGHAAAPAATRRSRSRCAVGVVSVTTPLRTPQGVGERAALRTTTGRGPGAIVPVSTPAQRCSLPPVSAPRDHLAEVCAKAPDGGSGAFALSARGPRRRFVLLHQRYGGPPKSRPPTDDNGIPTVENSRGANA